MIAYRETFHLFLEVIGVSLVTALVFTLSLKRLRPWPAYRLGIVMGVLVGLSFVNTNLDVILAGYIWILRHLPRRLAFLFSGPFGAAGAAILFFGGALFGSLWGVLCAQLSLKGRSEKRWMGARLCILVPLICAVLFSVAFHYQFERVFIHYASGRTETRVRFYSSERYFPFVFRSSEPAKWDRYAYDLQNLWGLMGGGRYLGGGEQVGP
jgi:hypothetical protein